MWKQRESPSRIEKRFEFEEYQKISIFLKKTDELCKEKISIPILVLVRILLVYPSF